MKRRRPVIVLLMISSLAVASVLRVQSLAWQSESSDVTNVRSSRGVGGLDTFALALVLGGLRGPLVMFLWSTSETQKANRDLEDFDTKVEWIRRLQPEFDTVHLFQMWNKAYNVSVLMASPTDKYVTIMRALQYGDNVLAEKPGDLNILQCAANIYANKLGGYVKQPEERFFSRQLSEESMTDANRKLAYPDDPHYRRLWQATLALDDSNNILPDLLKPARTRPAGTTGEWNDGSTLQYLARFQPFPHGISPGALAYNYSKRAQVAQTSEGQAPVQTSAMVVDSRPGVDLESWGLEEQRFARATEARAFGMAMPDVPNPDNDAQRDAIRPDAAPLDSQQMLLAADGFQKSVDLFEETMREFRRHMSNPVYAVRFGLYQSHLQDVRAWMLVSAADRDYLLARTKTGAAAAALRKQASAEYGAALVATARIVLTYYTEDELLRAVFPRNSGKQNIAQLPDDLVLQYFDKVWRMAQTMANPEYTDDRIEYRRTINRILARVKMLGST